MAGFLGRGSIPLELLTYIMCLTPIFMAGESVVGGGGEFPGTPRNGTPFWEAGPIPFP